MQTMGMIGVLNKYDHLVLEFFYNDKNILWKKNLKPISNNESKYTAF